MENGKHVTVIGGLASLLSAVFDNDAVVEDPMAEVKTRHLQIARLLWWVHRWQAFTSAVDDLGDGAREVPAPVTLIEVAAGVGLSRKQATALKQLPETDDDELLTLRIVTEIVDM